jgi:hypothetical protein
MKKETTWARREEKVQKKNTWQAWQEEKVKEVLFEEKGRQKKGFGLVYWPLYFLFSIPPSNGWHKSTIISRHVDISLSPELLGLPDNLGGIVGVMGRRILWDFSNWEFSKMDLSNQT